MSKKKAILYIFVCFVAIFLAFFSFQTIDSVNAAISGKEIESYVFTGYQGYYPYHYFDSLSYATHTKDKIEYVTSGGEITSEFRAIKSDFSNVFGSEYSKGSINIGLSGEMQALANTGHFYGYASAGVLSLNNKTASRVVISLSGSTGTTSKTNTKVYSFGEVYSPEWIKTGRVYLKDAEDSLTFQFSSLSKATYLSGAKFLIFEPSIHFGIEVDEITNSTLGATLCKGQAVKLSASTFLSNLEGSSLIQYYQNLHRIEWEVVSGSENGSVVGNYLNITGSTGAITVRPKCLRYSDSTEYVYGNEVTFQIDSTKYSVSAISNFEDGVTILGAGQYTQNRYVNLFATVKNGYSILSVEDESGNTYEPIAKNNGVYQIRVYLTNFSKVINVKLVKDIEIEAIRIKDKPYDKTDVAEIEEIIFKNTSLEHGVNVDLSSFTAKFNSISPQENIKITFEGQIKLSGEHVNYYNLISKIPSTTGNILKRNIKVKANNVEIEYGDAIPNLTYKVEGQMLEGDNLTGNLTVGAAQEIGEYEICVGTLNNFYYEIDFEPAILTITKRKINISNIFVEDKIYDKTTEISQDLINFDQTGSFLSSLDASLQFNASFNDVSAEKNKVVNLEFQIVGADGNFYQLEVESKAIYANILPKQVIVSAVAAEKVYGETDPVLRYSFDENDFFSGDILTGTVQRTNGENVGSYQIGKGSLNCANYEIIFQTATFTIKPKTISIRANNKEKIYGENDPELTYEIANGSLLNSDDLGLTLKRTVGEVVGTYNIIVNSQLNQNYQINFTSGQFTINKRTATINVLPITKQYDGLADCKLNIQIENQIAADNIIVNLKANFSSASAGQKQVIYFNLNNQQIETFDSKILSGSNLACYEFIFNISQVGQIEKRNIVITLDEEYNSKEFGDQDRGFCYQVENGINEELVGALEREAGEEIGIYLISHGTLTEENNQNYAIAYSFDDKFVITKKKLTVVALDKQIMFGQEEEIEFYLANEAFSIEEYVSGNPEREIGQNVGVYNYLIGSLKIKDEKINNYELEFIGGKLTIIPKEINITINDQTKVYGSQDPTFTFTSSQNIENFDIICTREEGEDVGAYIIYAEVLDSNYSVNFTRAVLSITPSKLTISANSIVKTYGEEDPALTYYISSGMFKFEDTLDSVISGSLIREAGEDAGEYNINIGSLRANQNYQIKFVSAKFNILKRDLFISADDKTMFINDVSQPDLTYSVSNNIDDNFTILLEREQGNEIGEYKITVKSVDAQNYNVIFSEGKFTIKKRFVKIEVNASSKVYDGSENAELSYKISGELKDGEELNVVLSRAPGINVGKYLITAECNNEFYEVEIVNNYFEILKRDIQIEIDSFEINYGEEIPNLTCTVTNDIENSELIVNLYRTENTSAGVYTIYASLLNAENYNIVCTNGSLTINKAKLEINIFSTEKVYGSTDPVFGYEIISGNLVGSDVLSGNISRKPGENVGEYELICNLNNENYEITSNIGKLTIMKKQIYLVTSAINKVYDGTDVALLRTPTLSGVLEEDEVYFEYEANTVAKFESKEVGNDIPVTVYGGTLAGKDAGNYFVIRPTNLTANITNAEIHEDSNNITVFAKTTNTNLSAGTILVSEDYSEKIDKNDFESSKNVLNVYNLNLTLEGEEIQDCGKLNVSIKLDKTGYNNVQVYRINEDNTKTLLNSSLNEDEVTFETDELGVFVVVADNDSWLNTVLIITICLTCAIGLLVAYKSYLNKKIKKSR